MTWSLSLVSWEEPKQHFLFSDVRVNLVPILNMYYRDTIGLHRELILAKKLNKYLNSAIDISDGLVSDITYSRAK